VKTEEYTPEEECKQPLDNLNLGDDEVVDEPSADVGQTTLSDQDQLDLPEDKQTTSEQHVGEGTESVGSVDNPGTDDKSMEEDKTAEKENPWCKWGDDPTIDYEHMSNKINEYLTHFYQLMNKKAAHLDMKKSSFAVAHGMHHDNNYSTALDIGKLCCHAMDNDLFRDIVCQQTREVRSLQFPAHVYKWENTN